MKKLLSLVLVFLLSACHPFEKSITVSTDGGAKVTLTDSKCKNEQILTYAQFMRIQNPMFAGKTEFQGKTYANCYFFIGEDFKMVWVIDETGDMGSVSLEAKKPAVKKEDVI